MRALAFLAASLAACIGARTEPLDDPEPEHEPWGVPISGGTMAITRDNARVVVADPDRDRVGIAAIDDQRVLATIELAAGSEPGRVIEDDAGGGQVLFEVFD